MTTATYDPDVDTTDNFASAYASRLGDSRRGMEAYLEKTKGIAEFPALFDLDGNLVAAKLIYVDDNYSFNGGKKPLWGILENDDPKSRIVAWVAPSNASTEQRKRANMAKKGYQVGSVIAPAAVGSEGGSGRGFSGMLGVYYVFYRADGGFDRDVTVVHDGAVNWGTLGVLDQD